MENNKNNSLIPLIVIFLVIAALIGGAYWFGKSSIMQKTPKEEVSDVRESTDTEEIVKEEEVVEETAEENIADTELEEEENTENLEEESNESVIETLKLLFAQKYEKNVEDVTVSIAKREGDYLTGGVKFAKEIAGGYVLAAKVNGAWKIVFDGNGNWTCSAVDIVDFPSTLVAECWDENNMTMVDRTAR